MSEDTGTATQRTGGTESDATSGGERRRALQAERDKRAYRIGREDIPPPPSPLVRAYASTTVPTGSIALPPGAHPAVESGVSFPARVVAPLPEAVDETAPGPSVSGADPVDPADDQLEPTPETDAELPLNDEPEEALAAPSRPEPPAAAPHPAPPGRSLFEPVIQPEPPAFDDVPFSAPPPPVAEPEPEPPQPEELLAAWDVEAAEGAAGEHALQHDAFAHDIRAHGPSTPRPFRRTPAERLTRALGDDHSAPAAGHGDVPGDGADAVDDEPVRGTLEPVLRHATERSRYTSATPTIRPPDAASPDGAPLIRPVPLTWDEALGMTVVPERGRRRRFAKPRHESGGPAEYRPKVGPDRSLTLLVVGMLLVLAVLVGVAVWFMWASAGGTGSVSRGAVPRDVAVRAP